MFSVVLYQVSAYCCENNITERNADNAYDIDIYVLKYVSIY